jgi:hypothetical protein
MERAGPTRMSGDGKGARKTGQAFSPLANTERMNDTKLCARIAKELFRRAQATETADIFDIADACGASVFAALKAVEKLDRAGFVDGRRLRLTLAGVALVAAFSHRRAPESTQEGAGRPLPRAQHAA